jgi:hypothetical protein
MKQTKEENNGLVRVGEYKGNKTISLLKHKDDKYPFTFGLIKAKLIVENFQAIKEFASQKE